MQSAPTVEEKLLIGVSVLELDLLPLQEVPQPQLRDQAPETGIEIFVGTYFANVSGGTWRYGLVLVARDRDDPVVPVVHRFRELTCYHLVLCCW